MVGIAALHSMLLLTGSSNLTQDARIRYCSDSVEDILGYLPYEVTGKSCWEYFHPDEIPFAQAIQGRGISLDKAAVMTYARVKHKSGDWIGCECSFTVVYDVLVATTAIYRRGPKARRTLVCSSARTPILTEPNRAGTGWGRCEAHLLFFAS